MGVAASDAGHTDCKFPCDCGRYVEIWNLVFMQFERQASGKFMFTPLPKPSIDTGMGLERVASVKQGKISNFDTDLFTPLIERAAQLTSSEYFRSITDIASAGISQEEANQKIASLRIIADHARASTFLISDGVIPANEGRGYVLRKIMRRAILHGRLLGQHKPFLHEMVYAVRDVMKGAYPELIESTEQIAKVVLSEENRFAHTLDVGNEQLEKLIKLTKIKHEEQQVALIDELEKERPGEIWKVIPKAWLSKSPKLIYETIEKHFGSQLSAAIKSNLTMLLDQPPILPGAEVFKLYDTFGLPLDFIEDAARDQGLKVDIEGFERAMTEQRDRARASWKGTAKQMVGAVYKEIPPTIFKASVASYISAEMHGQLLDTEIEIYKAGLISKSEHIALLKAVMDLTEAGKNVTKLFRECSAAIKNDEARARLQKTIEERYNAPSSSTILAIIVNGSYVKELKTGEKGDVFLDQTPFYAEAGGQVGDVGWFFDKSHSQIKAEIYGCYYPVQGLRAHRTLAKDTLSVGSEVLAEIDADIRQSNMRNHTATHLLHAALRETLGKHVKQAGSLVDPQHLRFDFSHFTSVADEELQDIEDLANKEVLKNTKVQTIEDVPIDVAVNEYKAMALFGEKYGERVRVIKIGDFSTELCGGTHTAQTGEIGLIKILNEGSVSSGVRRVEAVTGEGSLQHFRKDHELERVVSNLVSRREAAATPAEALRAELEKNAAEIKRLQKELDQVRMKSAASSVSSAEDNVKVVNGIKVLAQRVDNLERPQMRTLVDNFRNKLGSGVVVLGSVLEVESDGENGAKTKEKKVALIVGVTKDLTGKVQAGKIISPIAQKVGGSGGGRPDMAEAGGKNPAALDAALNESYAVVEALTK